MRGDPSAEALSCKQVSRSASEPLPLSLVIVKTHAAYGLYRLAWADVRRAR